MKKEDIKVLYAQIRADKETQEEEFDEFLRFSKISKEQFRYLNVFEEPDFDPNMVLDYDVFFIGGSSDDPEDKVRFPYDEFPFAENLEKMIVLAYENNIPSFLSCMGYAIAVWILGGDFRFDKENKEIGTYDIYLTEEGKKDRLTSQMPDVFHAVSGHKKRAYSLPPGAVNLAYSDLCPIHGFTFPGKPFYAFQFHAEIDKHDLIERIKRYIHRGYLSGDDELAKLIDTAKETHAANTLIEKFLETIVYPQT